MVVIYHDSIHHYFKVYVGDILAKYKKREDHISNLRVIFNMLREYKLRLKPQKDAFRVSSRKLIAFITSRRGIKVDPKKLKAIEGMPPRRNLKYTRSI